MEDEQDRLNDEVMELSQDQIDTILASVRKHLGPTNKPHPLKPTDRPKLIPGNTTIKRFGEK